jgi:Tfp pilus assembly protein PilX
MKSFQYPNLTGKSDDQTGMVLLICLIFLTALTLLGLTASADTVLQKKLSANQHESERARQSALATLAWAENWLLELEGSAPETCTLPCDGLVLHAPGALPSSPESENLDWWAEHGHEAGIDPLTGTRITSVSNNSPGARFWLVQQLHTTPSTEESPMQVWYRFLARGSDRSGRAVSVIESTIVRSWLTVENPEGEQLHSCLASAPGERCGRVNWRELR